MYAPHTKLLNTNKHLLHIKTGGKKINLLRDNLQHKNKFQIVSS